ncbi:MAG: class I SAM-dependent methyltransferase [Nannocystaceae bacterium]
MNSTDNRSYYDEFATGYDDGRDVGYHKLIDDQAAELVRRVGEGKRVLEVGCGTGLVLGRIAKFASEAKGIDLSPGMLAHAKARNLDVQEADCTKLPFEDASFDVACSFKVLAHVPDFDAAMAEMVRVVRPGGHLVVDIYNRTSIRYLIKRMFGPRKTSAAFDEAAIGTRFWNLEEALTHVPDSTRLVDVAGIRVMTPHPAVNRLPLVGAMSRAMEWKLMDGPLAKLGGFMVLTLERTA